MVCGCVGGCGATSQRRAQLRAAVPLPRTCSKLAIVTMFARCSGPASLPRMRNSSTNTVLAPSKCGAPAAASAALSSATSGALIVLAVATRATPRRVDNTRREREAPERRSSVAALHVCRTPTTRGGADMASSRSMVEYLSKGTASYRSAGTIRRGRYECSEGTLPVRLGVDVLG